VVSGQIPGLITATSFWLLILYFGGMKIATLGLDMLNGRKIKLPFLETKRLNEALM
jgi:hypothetical protein